MAGLSAAFAAQRLQLAAKAAIAAGIAFAIAPFMPGTAAEYPYYAPLGALVAMYHNVAGSVRQGAQTLVGLSMGIGLAFLLVNITDPSPLTVAIFMGAGVLLGGLPKIGSGSDWIPTAALLVLLVGGNNADDYSFGYLVQMGVGVLVGIAVNFLIFPPLHLEAAAASIEDLRVALGTQLTDMAEAVKEKWPPEHEEWSRRSDDLSGAARSVRHLVKEADASRRANPRRKLHPRDIDRDYRNLRELERVTFHIQDITDVLSDVIWESDVPYVLPEQDTAPLAGAMAATGELLKAYNEPDEKLHHESYRSALAAVEACVATTAERAPDERGVPASESIILSLHRILRALQTPDETQPAV
ncbi:aromatic acid exporter family protein [Pseudarthrobacter sp. NPDC058362]|uniref:FUSC family protein n=1 Tax=Pseudarthrobacter sp. NPDC058362 TaxID=3346458 RepID=UPI0036480A30